MRTLPLGFRIVFLVLPLALIPLGIVGGVAYTYVDAALRADVEMAQIGVLADAAGQLERSLDDASRLARLLAASPELGALLSRPNQQPAEFRRTIEVGLELSQGVSRIRVFGPAHTELLSIGRDALAPGGSLPPPPGAGRQIVAAGTLVLDSVAGQLLGAASHGVALPEGRAAWVTAELDTARIMRAWGSLAGTGTLALVDATGRVLAAAARGQARLPARLSGALAGVAEAGRLEPVQGVPEGFDAFAAPAGAFATMDDPAPRPVFLVSLVQQGAVVERVRGLRRTAGWLSATAVAIGLIGAGLIARTVVHPLSALLDMSRRIGEGQFNVALPRQRDDEIGQLVLAFNAMAASLADYKDKLIRAETFAALGRVASTVAHEVRNPLNAMRGCVELLRMKRPGDEAVQHYASIISEEIAALDDFVRDFLRVARLESPDLEPVGLEAIAQTRLEAHRGAAEAQGVRLQLVPGDRCPEAMADARQVSIVVDNLLNNAIEAMPDGGVVSVSCRPERDMVVLTVTDTGHGISPGMVPTLFTPFATTKPDGTGIGLAICRRIVEAHGGSIEFVPPGGRGAVFEVRLPVAVSADDAAYSAD